MKKKKNCSWCDIEINNKDVIALNKKLYMGNINSLLCLECMADSMETSVEHLNDLISQFKSEGCTLFQ